MFSYDFEHSITTFPFVNDFIIYAKVAFVHVATNIPPDFVVSLVILYNCISDPIRLSYAYRPFGCLPRIAKDFINRCIFYSVFSHI